MPRSRSSKPPLESTWRAVSSVSALLCDTSRSSLAFSTRSASTCSVMSLNTVRMAGSPANVTRRDETLAQNVSPPGPLQLEAQVLGPAVQVHLLRQHQPLRRVDVVVGRVLADGVVVGDAEDVRGPLVDGEDDVVAQPADHGRKRARVEELEEQRVVLAWGGIRHE